MDFPNIRRNNYDISNEWWFLPADFFKTEQDQENKDKTLRSSPILSYFDEISRKDKFKYLVIIFFVIILIYRLNLHWTIWFGILIGLSLVYYLNESKAQALNSVSDRIWSILKSPLLKETKYFVTDPELIQWVDEVSEFKKMNILVFNQMIRHLDQFLKLSYEIKLGVARCKENLDLIQMYKTESLNEFHSLVHVINNLDLRKKSDHYLQQLGYLLNERYLNLIKISKMYYLLNPINIDSHMEVQSIDEPTSNDQLYNGNYQFYH